MSTSNLLSNVHEGNCLKVKGYTFLISGKYDYYHTLCDGFNDTGWGCGYRTLQTICSWMNYRNSNIKKVLVPSIPKIQEILVSLEDKPKSFFKSREWIGSFEVCLVIEKLYDVPSKILHVEKGDQLETIVEILKNHFETCGSPVMMGGNVDCSSKGVMGINILGTEVSLLIVVKSKGVMGINILGTEVSLLIVDPHYIGKEESKEFLQNKGWVKWQPLNDFLSSSFYNLCLPQIT